MENMRRLSAVAFLVFGVMAFSAIPASSAPATIISDNPSALEATDLSGNPLPALGAGPSPAMILTAPIIRLSTSGPAYTDRIQIRPKAGASWSAASPGDWQTTNTCPAGLNLAPDSPLLKPAEDCGIEAVFLDGVRLTGLLAHVEGPSSSIRNTIIVHGINYTSPPESFGELRIQIAAGTWIVPELATTVDSWALKTGLFGATGTAETTLRSAIFNPNGGAGNIYSQSRTAGSSAALRANQFEQAGCAFTGWNTEANGTGVPYSNEENWPFTTNTSLFAQWASPGETPPDSDPCNPAAEPDAEPDGEPNREPDGEQPEEENSPGSSGVAGGDPRIGFDVIGKDGHVVEGTRVDMAGAGLPPGSEFFLRLYDPEIVLMQGVVDGSGNLSEQFRLPGGLAPGTYTLEFSVTGVGMEPLGLHRVFLVSDQGTFVDAGVNQVGLKPGVVVPERLAYTGLSSSTLPWWALMMFAMGLALVLYSIRARQLVEALDAQSVQPVVRTPWEVLATPIRVPGIDYVPGSSASTAAPVSLAESMRELDIAISRLMVRNMDSVQALWGRGF